MDEDKVRKIAQELIDKALTTRVRRIVHQSDILPKTIKARHIEDMVIKRGLAADLPDDGDAVGVLAFFATDTDTLYIWNGTAFVSEVLT